MNRLVARRLAGSGRRGSVFILVVAILAVLALLMITLTYTTRMELWASRNFVDQIQARIATVTGVPPFDPGDRDPPVLGFGANPGGVAGVVAAAERAASRPTMVPLNLTLDEKARERQRTMLDPTGEGEALPSEDGPAPEGKAEAVSVSNGVGLLGRPRNPDDASAAPIDWSASDPIETARLSARRDSTFGSSLAVSYWLDESAKWNLNAILPPARQAPGEGPAGIEAYADENAPAARPAPDADDFARFLDNLLEARRIRPRHSAVEIAYAIVRHRYGDDGAPGEAGVDDNGDAGLGNPNADGIDNDGDLVVDNAEEETFHPAADGIDNDRDGRIDEYDELPTADGVDNDFDGEIDEADEGLDDPAEFVSDIRRRPFGDDVQYGTLEHLLRVEEVEPEVFHALRPFVTVFSATHPAYPHDPNDLRRGIRQIDPNTASGQEIFDALRVRYPYLPPDAVAQFAVNVVDRRDPDDVPTILELGDEGGEFTGFEIAPRINEVFPYTGSIDDSADGDDGQFVEIVNPHTKTIDLSGWRLEASGTTIYLNGSLLAEGLLVVTDDYNNGLDPDPENTPGQGSLYDLFGVIPLGSKTRLMVEPPLEISDDAGEISLYNREGVRVDVFRYANGRAAGAGRKSFQRVDPFERKTDYVRDDAAPGTPGRPNRRARRRTPAEDRALRLVESFHNLPFRSPLEILYVPSGSSAGLDPSLAIEPEELPEEPEEETGPDPNPFYDPPPVVAPPATEPPLPALAGYEGEIFDASLVDVFMPGIRPARPTRVFSLAEFGFDDLSGAAPADRRSDFLRELRDAPEALHGRVNLNTASAATIAALPGADDLFAFKVAYLRFAWLGQRDPDAPIPDVVPEGMTEEDAWFEPFPPVGNPRWRSLSEFLLDTDLWGDSDLSDRVARLTPMSRMVAFHTLSLTVGTRNSAPVADAEDGRDRAPTIVHAYRLLAGDRGAPETIAFSLGDPSTQPDPDIKYGLPVAEISPEMAEFHPLHSPKLKRSASAGEDDGIGLSERRRREERADRPGETRAEPRLSVQTRR